MFRMYPSTVRIDILISAIVSAICLRCAIVCLELICRTICGASANISSTRALMRSILFLQSRASNHTSRGH